MTATEVYFTEPGFEDLQELDPGSRERVKSKLREARERPDHHLRGLRGYDLHVLRVGDQRVILDWDRSEDVLYVHAVGHRRNVYDRDL